MESDREVMPLTPAFENPELGSEQTFRAILEAMVHPGHCVNIKSRLGVDIFFTCSDLLAALPRTTQIIDSSSRLNDKEKVGVSKLKCTPDTGNLHA
jgi:alpha-D-ribose 1-methylphosphonate 5-triphosphate synthase subunit PhnH